MYELKHIKGNTYYIEGLTNIGLYKLNDNDICLIDCGYKEEGPILLDIIKKNNFNLLYVINTHSHPDHSGANSFLIKNTNTKLITSKIERAFMRNDKLDIGFLYGGYPLDEYDNKLMHIEEQRDILPLTELPDELWYFKLPGHHYDMFGIKTPDDVYFVADAIGDIDKIKKEHILLIYNVSGILNTFNLIEGFDGIIVPSHTKPLHISKMKEVIDFNRNKVYEIIDYLLSILNKKLTHEEIVSKVFTHYNLSFTYNRYLLINSTIRSYLSYLSNNKKIKTILENNYMYFILNGEDL